MADTPNPGRHYPEVPGGRPVTLPTPERRDAVVEKLTQAFASGRIELEDFEQRTERAMRARSLQELDSALDGLSQPRKPLPTVAPNSGEFVIDQPRRHTSRITVAVMSGVNRKGKWAPSRRHVTFAWMGGAHLDFREAVLQPGVTDVYLVAKWGGIEVAVPPGLDVDVSGFAIMGGLERISQESGSTDPRRPQLRIHAFAFMGGIEVRALQPGARWQEDEEEDAKE